MIVQVSESRKTPADMLRIYSLDMHSLKKATALKVGLSGATIFFASPIKVFGRRDTFSTETIGPEISIKVSSSARPDGRPATFDSSRICLFHFQIPQSCVQRRPALLRSLSATDSHRDNSPRASPERRIRSGGRDKYFIPAGFFANVNKCLSRCRLRDREKSPSSALPNVKEGLACAHMHCTAA